MGEAVWGEPIKLGGAFGVSPKAICPRAAAEAFLAEVHGQDSVLRTLGEFKAMLQRKYGSLFAAWRVALNTDKNAVVTQKDFAEGCRRLGMQGSKHLWKELDTEGRGQITLETFDAETAGAFAQFEQCLVSQFAHPRQGWMEVFDPERTTRVEKLAFLKGCQAIQYPGSAPRLFQLLLAEPGRTYICYDELWVDLNRNLFTTEARDHRSPVKRRPQPAV